MGALAQILPTTMSELQAYCGILARSGLVPKVYTDNPAAVLVAVQLGDSLGLSPLAALQNIAVVNGKPTLYGDGLLAVARRHPEFVSIDERIEGEGDDCTAICTIVRRGNKPFEARFSVEDAKRAHLWGKRGRDGQESPWVMYPKRMMQMRARGFCVRDAFPDALAGVIAYEEACDYPITTTVSATVADRPLAEKMAAAAAMVAEEPPLEADFAEAEPVAEATHAEAEPVAEAHPAHDALRAFLKEQRVPGTVVQDAAEAVLHVRIARLTEIPEDSIAAVIEEIKARTAAVA